MFTNKWFLPTIGDLLARESAKNDIFTVQVELTGENFSGENPKNSRDDLHLKAEREWYGAIAAVNQLLHQERAPTETEVEKSLLSRTQTYGGLVLSGPTPVLSDPVLASSFATSVFTSETSNSLDWLSVWARQTLPLLPASKENASSIPPATATLPLFAGDPLESELFCLVFAARFSLVMVLGENAAREPAFMFSFDPEIVEKAWILLRQRMLLLGAYCPTLSRNDPSQIRFGQYSSKLTILDGFIEQFAPREPGYKTVMQFGRLLLQNLPPEESKTEKVEAKNLTEKPTLASVTNSKFTRENYKSPDVELLQAIAHEVKTPLATIRTLTRLLLKRPNIDPDTLKKRLLAIDSECTAQIDRFGLFFRAVELETQQRSQSKKEEKKVRLTSISLADVFENSVPRWQKQATQRNHTLEVILPPNLPTVVSDQTMLDQVLGSLIESFYRNLPAGSQIQVEVNLAGNQLKLQLKSQSKSGAKERCLFANNGSTSFKSLGPLLMFQPETGSLILNLNVTKNLFEAIGGKLVVRQRPEKGEVMTIFLPLK